VADPAVLDDPVAQATYTQWRDDGGGRREAHSQFVLSGMHCAACAGLIEGALARQPGVLSAQVNAASERLALRWDPSRTRLSSLVAAVEAAGYGAAPDAAASTRALRQAEARQATWRLFVAAFCMMQVMMLAVPLYVAAPGEIPPDQVRLLNWGAWVLSLPVMLFSAAPLFRGAWRQLRVGRIGMDTPVALALLVTFVASTGATFDPGGVFGHEVYFDSLTMFVAFLLGARRLELAARHRAAAELEGSADLAPLTALRLDDDGQVREVVAQRLQAGERVRVPLGAAFPADGVIVEGDTHVDESLLTGESRALRRRAGDEVVAGSLNLGAPVQVRVLRSGRDTRQEAIAQLVRSALGQRPQWFALADRMAGPFLWAVLLLAAGAAAAWSLIDPSRAVWVAVSVLIVTCPCALSLAAPSALLAAASALSRRGVLMQRLDALEPLASATRLFVDKTGTLTADRLEPAGVAVLADGIDAQVAVSQAASLARHSLHPLSRAVAAMAPAGADDLAWTEVREVAGAGLEGRVQGRVQGLARDGAVVRLGSAAWLGVPADDAEAEQGAASSVWFGPPGAPWIRIALRESLREGAAQAVRALQHDGVRVTVLSGDAPARVAAVARRVGLDDPVRDAIGAATPESKLAALADAQAAGETVAMIGDGINDAPVLARADVSFAMGEGALLARARADATLTGMDLRAVVLARRIARRTRRIVRQNLAWAALYNAACIPLALAGLLPPWLAGLGMAASSLLVVLNALRVARVPAAAPDRQAT